jgi:hypothetical protein
MVSASTVTRTAVGSLTDHGDEGKDPVDETAREPVEHRTGERNAGAAVAVLATVAVGLLLAIAGPAWSGRRLLGVACTPLQARPVQGVVATP